MAQDIISLSKLRRLLIQDKAVSKVYLAIVARASLQRLADEGFCFSASHPTHYRVLQRFPNVFDTDLALVRLEVRSASYHQIRKDMSLLGWPIIGDARYGGLMSCEMDRCALHCSTIELPAMGERSRQLVECALPEDMTAVLGILQRAAFTATEVF